MGLSLNTARRGRGRRGGGGGPVSEINVTPLVDVMLVLLIVFMVTAPLLTSGVPIDLPQTAAPEMPTAAKPITVSINPAGEIYLAETLITLEALLPEVALAAGEAGKEQRIYIRGDAEAHYGLIMQVMGALSGAGYARIGLITAPAKRA
jgi:biopolymer transport protein TolR